MKHAIIFVFVAFVCAEPALARGWQTITHDHGVTVEKKDVPGRDLPTFRGISVMNGGIYDVLTVLDDTPGRTEWVHRCIESRVIKQISDFERYVYNRTKAPWPVMDRDALVLTKITVNIEKRTVKIAFKAAQGIFPEVDDVVRIPNLEGFYYMEALSESKTRVTYQLDLDPGGWLPNWLIKRTSLQIPLMTLRKLKKQVKKVAERGDFTARRASWHARLKKATGQVIPEGTLGL